MTEASALQRLQQIDIELLRHASTLQKLPQQAKLKTIALAKKKVAVELKKITGKRKDVEIDVVDVNADISHYRQVRERVMAEAEEWPLTNLESRTVEETNAQKMMERLDAEERNVQKSFEEDSSSVRDQILALKDEREAVAAEISDDVMARYEAARKRFGGLAVETLVGNVPSTCRVKLQPSQYHDIAHGDEICECPYCHRILITTQDGE